MGLGSSLFSLTFHFSFFYYFLSIKYGGVGKTYVKYLNVDSNSKYIYMDKILRGRTKVEKRIL
jgi:hypothetical protein